MKARNLRFLSLGSDKFAANVQNDRVVTHKDEKKVHGMRKLGCVRLRLYEREWCWCKGVDTRLMYGDVNKAGRGMHGYPRYKNF